MLVRMTSHRKIAEFAPRPGPTPREAADLERRTELARFLPLWPHEIADVSLSGRRRIVQFLARALRQERQRGRGGHWAYDLTRHARLSQLWRAERKALLEAEARTKSVATD